MAYSPHPIWGGHFGAYRYRGYAALAPRDLALRLQREGFDTPLVHTTRWPGVHLAAEFSRYFSRPHEAADVRAYRVRASGP